MSEGYHRNSDRIQRRAKKPAKRKGSEARQVSARVKALGLKGQPFVPPRPD